MGKRKSRYSIQQHIKLGHKLRTMRGELIYSLTDLMNAFPQQETKKIAPQFNKAINAIDSARSSLENLMVRDSGLERVEDWPVKFTKVYYGGGRALTQEEEDILISYDLLNED